MLNRKDFLMKTQTKVYFNLLVVVLYLVLFALGIATGTLPEELSAYITLSIVTFVFIILMALLIPLKNSRSLLGRITWTLLWVLGFAALGLGIWVGGFMIGFSSVDLRLF